MRTDHFAYQRATKVAGFGLLMQIAIGILLLVFGLVSKDTPFVFASMYVLPGVLVWLGLVIVFHQHKLERLEALEEDELASTRREGGSVFDKARDESLVAARRLGLMHKWFIPGLSVLLVLILTGIGLLLLRHMRGVRPGATAFDVTDLRGWAVAICLAVATVSFIFSRFVAGMSKQGAWANLRGGAAYMVGNAIILVAVAIGIIFRFFDNAAVIEKVAWAIGVLMLALALEIALNFVLNLYRPRVPGEVPRPAFDSKILSLFAAPDNIVRSLNEAVNYQFGFDVTSSWGYQLLLRSVASLLGLGVVALVLLSMMVIVEPHQQAVRLRGGSIVGDRVHSSGILWKRPWPLESAAVYDVSRLRNLWLTARVTDRREVSLWTGEPPATDTTLQPFLVSSPGNAPPAPLVPGLPAVPLPLPLPATTMPAAGDTQVAGLDASPPTEEDRAAAVVSAQYSLVDAEIILQYRIKSDGSLLEYIRFASDDSVRGSRLTQREQALREIALTVVSSALSRRSLDDVLSPGRSDLALALAREVQAAFDSHRTGVEVIAVEMPMLRPSGASAEKFEELSISAQGSTEFIEKARRDLVATSAYWIGDANLSDEVLKGIDEYNALRAEGSPDALPKRQEVERLLVRGGGNASQIIAAAERDRWVKLMRTRAQTSTVQSQVAAYRAAPELYRQREIMRVYAQLLPSINKFVIGIDPARVQVDMDLKDINPILDFAGASESEVNRP